MYYGNLELRTCSSSGDNLRVSFENLLSITIHSDEIIKEAVNLGGTIVNESLILFPTSTSLLKLVSFITILLF